MSTSSRPRFELDHVFILVQRGAPEADFLLDFGLHEGAPNQHPGQGTANRRFFFSNVMLELLWVSDESEALTPPAHRLCLVDRSKWRENGASPFGICLRPIERTLTKPFAGWPYCPAYLPDSTAIHVGDNSDRIKEPLLFYLDFAAQQADLSQPPRLRTVEAVRVNGLPPGPSSTVEAIGRMPRLELSVGGDAFLELQFGAGHSADFRPELPLIIRA